MTDEDQNAVAWDLRLFVERDALRAERDALRRERDSFAAGEAAALAMRDHLRDRIQAAESAFGATAHAIGICHCHDGGACVPGPLDRVLEALETLRHERNDYRDAILEARFLIANARPSGFAELEPDRTKWGERVAAWFETWGRL